MAGLGFFVGKMIECCGFIIKADLVRMLFGVFLAWGVLNALFVFVSGRDE